jgi:hypothetical protein
MSAAPESTSALRIDESLWPVVVFELGDGMTDRDWSEMFGCYSRLYTRAERFCPITDGSKMTRIPSASTRSLIARLTKEHEVHSRARILHSFAVAGSELTRGLLTALNWLSPPVYPIEVLTSLHEAKQRARAVIVQAGYPVPPLLDQQLARR